MMDYPKVRFQLNKKLDKEMCLEFLDLKEAGVDFGAGIIELYPELESVQEATKSKKQGIIDDFVDIYYLKQLTELKERVRDFKKTWRLVEKKFYQEVEQIFDGYPWPKGKYICYLSIFNCNPRFLEDKTFQVFYRYQDGISSVVAHEMLHFMFYDYIAHKFLKQYAKESKEKIWEISEVFNSLILTLPPFGEIVGPSEILLYPEHAELLLEFKNLWKHSKNIDDFLTQVL